MIVFRFVWDRLAEIPEEGTNKAEEFFESVSNSNRYNVQFFYKRNSFFWIFFWFSDHENDIDIY